MTPFREPKSRPHLGRHRPNGTHPEDSATRYYVLAGLVWCVAAITIKPFFAYVDFGAFYSTAIETVLFGAPLEWYALAVSCFLYLAFVRDRDWQKYGPVAPMGMSVLLRVIRRGAWVGATVSSSIRLRTMAWVIALGGIADNATRTLLRGCGRKPDLAKPRIEPVRRQPLRAAARPTPR